MQRLRLMAEDAFRINPKGCRSIVAARFPMGTVPETALESLAQAMRDRFSPAKVISFSEVSQRMAGGM